MYFTKSFLFQILLSVLELYLPSLLHLSAQGPDNCPLLGCCEVSALGCLISFSSRIKRTTLLRLQLLAEPEYQLSAVMRESLLQDPLAPVLTEPHLLALDRRLQLILKAVRKCIDTHGEAKVVANDTRQPEAPASDRVKLST